MIPRSFVAIDGESYSTSEGEHLYVLLAASTGEYVYNGEGISTARCFKFLLDLKDRNRQSLFVAFGLNYDVNMILRDLGKDRLQELWTNKKVSWYGYRINWVPGKWFSLSRDKTTIRIYDVFGFFQMSFVNALKKWNIELTSDLEEMKSKRSVFDEQMKDSMIAYCIGECVKLTELMEATRNALLAVNLIPKSWVGAGSIASTMLRREGVRNHHNYETSYPEECRRAILHAYFGGRIELFQQGQFDTLIDYDVCSAYPSQCLQLPSMVGGYWEHVTEYDRTQPHAIYRVRWDLDPKRIVMPFPFRHKRMIYYPSQGTGWYHAPEVKQALAVFPDIQVLEGWVYHPSINEKPFAFIREMYDHRAHLKRIGHPSEKVLKLGLNAIYGKLAQGVGYRGKLPPFQSFYWAGRITSGTRARLFDIAHLAPDNLVMIATDGIFFREPSPDLVTSTVLGGLERSIFTDMFVAQAGVYHGWTDGQEVRKSRGFFAREIDFDQIREGYAEQGPSFTAHYPSHRFVGLGSALMRNDFRSWAKWVDTDRKLCLYPNRKFIDDNSPDDKTRHLPPHFGKYVESEIYIPKGSSPQERDELLEFVQGTEQPMREGVN